MLRSGITCFADRNFYPEETARAAGEQGMRAMVGMPVAAAATPWGKTAAQSLTRSLQLRDEYRGHPLISTAFAVHDANGLDDEAFSHLATLTDELDAGITIELHQSDGEIRALHRQIWGTPDRAHVESGSAHARRSTPCI